jgi:asparagine synthase (glutamine-hydrolysing)
VTGIIGYSKLHPRSPSSGAEAHIKEMAETIATTSTQEIHLSLGEFVDAALVTHKGVSFSEVAKNEDESLISLLYGKIFGFDRDVCNLEGRGHTFRQKGGGELILHAYEEGGTRAFVDLNGSFLVFISHVNAPEFLLVSDHFGTRPLYYAVRDGELVFSSLLRGVLAYPVPKRLNIQALIDFMRYGRVGLLGDKTWIEGIRLMPPASVLRFSARGCEVRKYWDFEYSRSDYREEPEIVKSLVRTFREAVRRRVRSDVGKCFVSLSGGLDTRAVVGSLDRSDLLRIFAATFGEGRGRGNCDEVRMAKKVCRELGVRHVVVDEYFFNDIERYVEFVIQVGAGEAPVDLIKIPHFFNRLGQEGAECFLQGFALDVLLGGSRLRRQLFRIRTFSEFLRFLDQRNTVFADMDLERLLKKELHPRISLARKEFAEIVDQCHGDCFANRADSFCLATRERRLIIMGSLLYREFFEELLPTVDKDFIEVIRKIPPELRYRHRIFRKFLMALSIELAKISNANSLVPPIFPLFLWDFGPGVRESLRRLQILSRGVVKVSLKQSFDTFVPEALRTDPNWRRMINNALLNGSHDLYKYVNREEVERLVHEHLAGINDHSEKLIQLMTAELFLESLDAD